MRMTRRRLLGEALAGAGGLVLGTAGCGGAGGRQPAASGSTLATTWSDPAGDGQLRPAAGEAMVARTELGPAAPAAPGATPAVTLAHITDAHVLDASSPARVTFLDRLGPPFQSTFRPQEALTAQVLAGAANAVRALTPQLVIQGGDLIDNAQSNELAHALLALRGGRLDPGSGRDGYFGVQLASNTDPFYYRPDVDAPRNPGLLRQASQAFVSGGVGAPVSPVFGDHDALVAGEIVPTTLTMSLAIGDRALWELPSGLSLPPGARRAAAVSPDGPPDPGLVGPFLEAALAGPTVRVPPDPARAEMSFGEALSRLAAATAPGVHTRHDASGDLRLDYAVDAGPGVRVIVLDLVRRGGGSGGLVEASQPQWLAGQLAAAGDRWVIVVSHQPIEGSPGGGDLLALLDRAPRVIAALSGHTHRNRITSRPTPAGGYWLISTASLIDYPQQARALRIARTHGGGVAIHTWMLDHVSTGRLGTVARQLSYLDAQGGRPGGFAGGRADRNAILYRRAA
ncbi:MAG TPA: metallophosphoesterase [Solirubrobacteraceae bacterium]|nr:metallophosphoesterase [Solirubrobacteraceae bacterium]